MNLCKVTLRFLIIVTKNKVTSALSLNRLSRFLTICLYRRGIVFPDILSIWKIIYRNFKNFSMGSFGRQNKCLSLGVYFNRNLKRKWVLIFKLFI